MMPDTSAPEAELPTRVTRGAKLARQQAGPLQAACVVLYSGKLVGQRHVLQLPHVTVGRSAGAGIVIADDSVSREHARFAISGTTVQIEDLGSSNGTLVNGQTVQGKATLRDGDMLQFGSIHLKFFSADSVESAFHDEIFRKATVDAGTQVFNRQYLLESLDTAFTYCRARSRPVSVIYFDLDFFKRVNDTHGHSCGDFVLKESAQLAKTCLRDEDVLGRYGGEEFVVVLPDCDERLAAALAERLRKTVEHHEFVYNGIVLKQTVSLGVSEIHPQFADWKALLDDADRKLYHAKHSGRNQVMVNLP